MVDDIENEKSNIDYLWLMKYLENNRGLAYSKPDKASPDFDKFNNIRKKLEKLQK